jgi:predicted ester cyclase
MLSLVSALLPPGTDPRTYTPREQANIETVLKLRSAPFRERQSYMHPAMVRHRWGFASLADVSGMKDGAGYDASTCSDRMDTIEDLIAKDDRVWAVWTMRGTHTGQLFGIPATGRRIEILEAGIWRLVDGLVIEAWFFGDELSLLRELGGRRGHANDVALGFACHCHEACLVRFGQHLELRFVNRARARRAEFVGGLQSRQAADLKVLLRNVSSPELLEFGRRDRLDKRNAGGSHVSNARICAVGIEVGTDVLRTVNGRLDIDNENRVQLLECFHVLDNRGGADAVQVQLAGGALNGFLG